MKLTVIVPVFNEVKTILQAVKEAEGIEVADKEIIIIDNCSTDGTREILKNLKLDGRFKLVLNEKNLVSGNFAVALNLARGEYLYLHHSDLEYPPENAVQMLAVAEAGGYDVIFGSRLKSSQDRLWDIIRKRPAYLASLICTHLVNRWYGKSFTDVIGIKLYRTASIKKIPMTTFGHGFEFENVSRLCRAGFKLTEIPISYQPRSYQEGKKIRPYHLINALIALFRVRFFG